MTDLTTCHNTWFHKDVDRCFVASEESRQRALKMGIGQHKITVHGLPIRPSFSQKLPSKRQLRQQLGMDLQKPAVLLVGMITTPNSAQHFMTASVFQSKALLALHSVVLHGRQWQQGLRAVIVLSPAVTHSTTKSCCHCVKHSSTCAAHRINIAASLMTSQAQPGTASFGI